MLILPISIPPSLRKGRGPLLIVVILERDNLDRMREGDPADIQFGSFEHPLLRGKAVNDLDLVVAYEEDSQPIKDLISRGDIGAVLKYIERGRVHRDGDALPPIYLRQKADQ
jgi:hypothetical protein